MTKVRRGCLQFSLRTVLVVMTVLAVGLGTWLERGRREKAAVEALEQQGYTVVVYEYQVDVNGRYVRNPRPPGPEWARRWLGKHCSDRVVGLTASCSTFNDESLRFASQLHQLRTLDNSVIEVRTVGKRASWSLPCNYATRAGRTYEPITDTGLGFVNGLTRLESLIMIGTVVTDDGLRHLRGLRRLKRLKISSPNITDEGIPYFLRLKRLDDLCVSGTSISEAGVAELRGGLPDCEIVGPADISTRER